MKKLKISALWCNLYFYREDERARFEKEFNCETLDHFARTRGNGAWVSGRGDVVGTCYHEAVHLADWIIEDHLEMPQGTLDSNKELRAYLTEYIGTELRKYITGE